jgi:hypothetical protein
MLSVCRPGMIRSYAHCIDPVCADHPVVVESSRVQPRHMIHFGQKGNQPNRLEGTGIEQ